MVAGIAFGGSAFKNVNTFHSVKGNKAITAPFLVQPTAGTYSQSSGDGDCVITTTLPCSYTVQFPNSIPDKATYTTAEIASYVASGWLVDTGRGNRLYSE